MTRPAHFSRAFRAAYGVPPAEYRRIGQALQARPTRPLAAAAVCRPQLSRWALTPSATTAASWGKPNRIPEPRRISQRSPR
jgi:hypothetical protein